MQDWTVYNSHYGQLFRTHVWICLHIHIIHTTLGRKGGFTFLASKLLQSMLRKNICERIGP